MTDQTIPVVSSLVHAGALADLIAASYPLPAPVTARLISRSMNDVYRVTSAAGTHYARLSPHGTRTAGAIDAECALILKLHERGVAVGLPLARADAGYVTSLLAPEGERAAVLFHPATGDDVAEITTKHARAFGQLAAKLHNAFDTLENAYDRPSLDAGTLIDEPMAAITSVMAEQRDAIGWLTAVAARVRGRLADLPRDGVEFGLCHGDLHPGNVRFDHELHPTLLDFDLCGYSWRAYDLAVFLWNSYGESRSDSWRESRWGAFLQGYRTERAMPDETLTELNVFLAARQIWLIGMDCAGATEWQPQWLTSEWFDRMLTPIRRWVETTPTLQP